MFTDINLSGAANGWDVADCFRTERPMVPMLYTSGKSVDRGRCIAGSMFVPKPYRSSDIVTACQRVTSPRQ